MGNNQVIRLHSECIDCLIRKQIGFPPETASEADKITYRKRMLAVLAGAQQHQSAPELLHEIEAIQQEMFGNKTSYAEIKSHFNELMLSFENTVFQEIASSADPLKAALQFSMVGNYIDFGALDSVSPDKVHEFLEHADEFQIEDRILQDLKRKIPECRSIVVLTDNCGEIVMDKQLIRVVLDMAPEAEITVIVKGEEVINDATMEDAEQAGLTRMERVKVIGNGCDYAGTCLEFISAEARAVLAGADLILAKGQANFETLRGCGAEIYYIFLCKCALFANRFRVPQYHGLIVKEGQE